MRITLDDRDWPHADAVRAAAGGVLVERGDYTCVEGSTDEIAGATLLARVHSALATARGESGVAS